MHKADRKIKIGISLSERVWKLATIGATSKDMGLGELVERALVEYLNRNKLDILRSVEELRGVKKKKEVKVEDIQTTSS